MSQATFDDDDLFGEAATEMREAVETALANAQAELPEPDAIWTAEADNTLGVLNGLRSALDIGDAESELRAAKKQFVVGERADAFEDATELETEIEAVETTITQISAAHESVSELATTVPELRSTLEEATESDES
jgi:ABC-type sugar transport system substrate-binding protein